MKLHAFGVAFCVALLSPVAVAQEYPVKPVRLIAPFPPGGTTDVLCRFVAQKLGEGLGRQVVVENRPGAGGNIGHEAAAKSPADGYTLVISATGAMVANQFLYKRLGFDPYNDFSPISVIATSGPVLVVHPSIPARSVKELVAVARARPGQLNFGSGGVGTTAHIATEVFRSAAGIKIVHVPYKGNVLAVTDTVSGHIEAMFADMVPSVPHIKSGRLRGLAITPEQRSPTLPELPTMVEAGIKQPFPQTWWALNSPKGTPSPIVSRLNTEVGRMMKQPEVQERYNSLGIFTQHTTPEQVTERMKREAPVMAKVMKDAGIKPDL
jgi:tripartite-type tricarboxylate transporter receptor subunit TctC